MPYTARVTGEWIQAKLSEPSIISMFGIRPKITVNAPSALMLLGSVDGQTWTYITYINQMIWHDSVTQKFPAPSSSSESWYRLVVVKAPSTWDIAGLTFATLNGPLLTDWYTTTGTYGSVLQKLGITKAELTWSWPNALLYNIPTAIS